MQAAVGRKGGGTGVKSRAGGMNRSPTDAGRDERPGRDEKGSRREPLGLHRALEVADAPKRADVLGEDGTVDEDAAAGEGVVGKAAGGVDIQGLLKRGIRRRVMSDEG